MEKVSEKRIAIYMRLSSADEETGRSKDESNSIVNQRGLIHHFLDEHPELSGCSRTEFVDDGFSGANMDRPAFQRMITAIKKGEFSCCITKDFSRFARDYIETGEYLECLFPFLKVRYISVNDGYDSNSLHGTTGGLEAVMRAIIYDAYSKDLSLKVKTGHAQGRKKGRRVIGYPGFGYRIDPEHRAMDVIDPEAAAIVRRIFDSVIGGMSIGTVVKMLNSEDVPTPGVYFRQRNPGSRKYAGMSEHQRWNYRMVYSILKRYAYTGAAVGGMREKLTPGSRRCIKKSISDWIIVPGMHEAIVTPEEFELAQKRFAESRFLSRKAQTYSLKSLVCCGNCLRHMERHKETTRFHCRYGQNGGERECAAIRSPKERILEGIVFRAIQDYMEIMYDLAEKRKLLLSERGENIASGKTSIEMFTHRIELLKTKKFQEYELFVAGKISKDDYLQKKKSIDNEIAEAEAEKEAMQERFNISESSGASTEVEALCDLFRGEGELTYDMAHAFVDRILVYPDERIEIQWKYCDCFSRNEETK